MLCIAKGNLIVGVCADKLEIDICPYKYVSIDKIDLYEVIRYMKNKKRISKTENYEPKRNCLNQIYIYDIDDIKDVIKETIEQYEKKIKSYEKQLNLADKAYIEFVTAIDNANKDLLKNCECIDDKTCLYYAIKNSVIKNI